MTYRTYAVGLHIADAAGTLGIGPWSYQLSLTLRTIGVGAMLYRGHQDIAVYGIWSGHRPAPRQFNGTGLWRGEPRALSIEYDRGMPTIRQLLPPLEAERERVPPHLQPDTIDSLSTLAALIRAVERTGRCETTARTFDGRRVAEIAARTVGPETLETTSRSSFSGTAMRCDFVSRVVAGFRADEDKKTDYRPLRGSAWLADVLPGRPLVPVRISIQTRWFGNATSYLASINGDTAAVAAERVPSGR